MVAIKAERNKTINTSIVEGMHYLQRCIVVQDQITNLEQILNKTIHGDTFSVLPYLPHSCVDLLIVDPPYNLSKTYATNKFAKKSYEEYEYYTQQWLDLVFHLLKDTASIYIYCDWETSLIIGNCLKDYFIIRNRITWQREKGRGAKLNWKNSLEDIWFATKSDHYTFNLDAVKIRTKVLAPYRVDGKPKYWQKTKMGNYRNTCPSNFWDDITIPFWSMPENTSHPTQKPEKLIAKIILASSNIGDVICDPFLDSGTTSVTAKKLKRNYIGIEQEAQYCLWTEQRLAMADQDQTIQGYVDDVFWERNTLSKQLNCKQKNLTLLDNIR